MECLLRRGETKSDWGIQGILWVAKIDRGAKDRDGGRVQDQFFDDDNEPGMVGPFDGVDAFHEGLIMVLDLKWKKSKKKIMEQFSSEVSKGKGYRIMLTHNDIVARNVMVKGDNVCAIVDWELAGFFPDCPVLG